MTGLDTDSAQAIRPRAPPGGVVALGTAQITSLEPPRFVDPVSQYFTPAQAREAAFERWRMMLDRGKDDWPAAFVLQALDRYGMLIPGARGADLGDAAPGLARVLAQHGVSVEQCSGRDFAWALRATLPPVALLSLARDMLAILRAGGLGILVFPFGARATGRSDVERVAIDLIADGHAVAALKFRGSDSAATVPFGLVFGRSAA